MLDFSGRRKRHHPGELIGRDVDAHEYQFISRIIGNATAAEFTDACWENSRRGLIAHQAPRFSLRVENGRARLAGGDDAAGLGRRKTSKLSILRTARDDSGRQVPLHRAAHEVHRYHAPIVRLSIIPRVEPLSGIEPAARDHRTHRPVIGETGQAVLVVVVAVESAATEQEHPDAAAPDHSADASLRAVNQVSVCLIHHQTVRHGVDGIRDDGIEDIGCKTRKNRAGRVFLRVIERQDLGVAAVALFHETEIQRAGVRVDMDSAEQFPVIGAAPRHASDILRKTVGAVILERKYAHGVCGVVENENLRILRQHGQDASAAMATEHMVLPEKPRDGRHRICVPEPVDLPAVHIDPHDAIDGFGAGGGIAVHGIEFARGRIKVQVFYGLVALVRPVRAGLVHRERSPDRVIRQHDFRS